MNIFALVIHRQKSSWRGLEEVLVKTNILVLVIRLQDVFNTFSRRLGKTSSRHLQDVLKSFWRQLQDIFKTSCQDAFKTSSKRPQDVLEKRLHDVFKTSSTELQGVLQRCPQDVFKTNHQVKLFLLTRLRDVFNTFLRHTTKSVIYKKIC